MPRIAILLAASLTAAAPALAQQGDVPPAVAGPAAPDDAAAFGDTITVGGALAYLPDYEGSDDYRAVPAPAAIGAISGFNFQLLGNRLNVDVIRDNNSPGGIDIQAGPLAVVNFNRQRDKSIDDRRVRALGEVNTAIELGGFVGVGKVGVVTSPYDRLSVSVSYRHDVANGHESGIWQPSVSYFTPLSRKAAVGLFGSLEHAGDGYARSYFGVTPAQSAASGFAVYDARGGWKNWSLGAVGAVSLTGDLLKGFKLVAGGNYRRMLNDFAASPVTSVAGSRGQWLGAVGLAYTF